jgi:hypothetical protein
MIDRQKVETILRRRFPDATWEQIAAAANAIMGLGDEWEELTSSDLARLAPGLEERGEFRLLRRTVLKLGPHSD